MNETASAVAVPEIPEDLDALTIPQLRAIVDAIREADVWPSVPKGAPKAAYVESIEMYREKLAVAAADSPDEIEADPEDVELESEEEVESQALALREEPVVHEMALLPTEAEFVAMQRITERIASTQMVPTAYRGKPDDVLAAILTGREMGLGPMQSLRDIYVVDGKPTLSATLLMAQLRRGGVIVLESDSTPDRAWIKAKRRDTGEVAEVEWTYAEASKITYRKKGGASAKLVDKDNWQNYQADMLWARCVGRLARRLGSDLIGSVLPYTSEEVQDWDEGGETGTLDASAGGKTSDGWIVPEDWRVLSARFTEALGPHDAAAWMEELAEKAYAHPSIGAVVQDAELDADRKRDLWQRLCRVLKSIEDAGDLTFRDDTRSVVQRAIYEGFDQRVALLGPSWATGPSEAEKGMPSREEVTGDPDAPGGDLPSGATDEPPAASEAADEAGARPEGANLPGDEAPITDADGDPLKF